MAGNLENILLKGDCIPEDMMLQYMDGKLTPKENHLVEKHLLECAFCSDALEGLKLMGSDKARKFSAALNEKIDARVQAAPATEAKVISMRSYYRIAAVIALFILFGGGYWYLNKMEEKKSIAELTTLDSKQSRNDSTGSTPLPQLVPQVSSDQKAVEPIVSRPNFQNEVRQPASGQGLKMTASAQSDTMSYTQSRETLADETKEKAEDVAVFNDVSDLSGSQKDVALTQTEKARAVSKASESETDDKKYKASSAEAGQITESNIVLMDRASKDSQKNISYDIKESSPRELFERASANYAQKRYPAAEHDLEILLNDTASAYYDDAKWMLANCYMKNKKNAKSRKLLKEIANSNSVHKKAAFGLLQED